MPFIKPLDRATVPELEQTFQDTEAFLGFLPNDVLTMAYMPAPTKAFMDFCLAIYQNATLPQELLHMIGMVASAAAGCRYCTAHLANKMNDGGGVPDKIAKLWEFQSDPQFTPAERAALELALVGGQSPSGATQAHFDAASRFYTQREIVEILFIICQFGFWNRWNDTVGTTLEDAPKRFSEDALPSEHWTLDKHAG